MRAQSGYEIGYETIHYIQNLVNGKHLKKKYYLNAEILTQDNVKEYRKKMKVRSIRSSYPDCNHRDHTATAAAMAVFYGRSSWMIEEN